MVSKLSKWTLLRATPVVVSLILAGCGGSGGSGGPATGDGLFDAGSPGSAVLNPLAPDGELLVGNEFDGPFILDFRTGNFTEIAELDWEERMDQNIFAGFWVRFSDDRQEIIESVTSCMTVSSSLIRDDCVILRDSAGQETSSFTIPSGASGGLGLHPPAQLSPDGQFIAAAVDLDEGLGRLHIFNRAGDILSSSAENQLSSGDQFVWLPDNSLVYASEQSLYLTNPNSAQGSFVVEFPTSAGRPGHLAISPDGTRLAFSLITNPNPYEGSVWVLNLDGSDFVRLAVPPPGMEFRTRFPVWSPDGEQIFLVDGDGLFQFAYIVPADGDDVLLTIDQPTEAVRIDSFFVRDTGRFPPDRDPETEVTIFSVFSNGLQWLR